MHGGLAVWQEQKTGAKPNLPALKAERVPTHVSAQDDTAQTRSVGASPPGPRRRGALGFARGHENGSLQQRALTRPVLQRTPTGTTHARTPRHARSQEALNTSVREANDAIGKKKRDYGKASYDFRRYLRAVNDLRRVPPPHPTLPRVPCPTQSTPTTMSTLCRGRFPCRRTHRSFGPVPAALMCSPACALMWSALVRCLALRACDPTARHARDAARLSVSRARASVSDCAAHALAAWAAGGAEEGEGEVGGMPYPPQ
jgi:hypothetical protein